MAPMTRPARGRSEGPCAPRAANALHRPRLPPTMLVCFTFQAKQGREKEFTDALRDPDAGRHVASKLGATRNTLFLSSQRMVRVLEFPDGITPRSLGDVAKEDAGIAAFLRKLGPLIEDGFDIDDPDSLAAFNRRAMVPLAYDVRP